MNNIKPLDIDLVLERADKIMLEKFGVRGCNSRQIEALARAIVEAVNESICLNNRQMTRVEKVYDIQAGRDETEYSHQQWGDR